MRQINVGETSRRHPDTADSQSREEWEEEMNEFVYILAKKKIKTFQNLIHINRHNYVRRYIYI